MSTAYGVEQIHRDDLPEGKVLCEYCTAKCCRYFALPIETPDTFEDLEYLRWYMLHDRATVFKEDDDWYLLVHANIFSPTICVGFMKRVLRFVVPIPRIVANTKTTGLMSSTSKRLNKFTSTLKRLFSPKTKASAAANQSCWQFFKLSALSPGMPSNYKIQTHLLLVPLCRKKFGLVP